MAVAYDNASQNTVGTNGATITLSGFDPVSADNLVVIVFTANYRGATPTIPTGVTYGGTPMTFITSAEAGSHVIAAWRIGGISASAADIVATWSVDQGERWIGAISFTGVDQASPVADSDAATGTAAATGTLSVTGDANGMGVDGCFTEGSEHTEGTDQTERLEQTAIGGFETASVSTKAGAATISMSQSWSAPPDRPFRYIAISLTPAPSETITVDRWFHVQSQPLMDNVDVVAY